MRDGRRQDAAGIRQFRGGLSLQTGSSLTRKRATKTAKLDRRRTGAGAATLAGGTFQEDVCAWLAILILAESATPAPFDLPAATSLETVISETFESVDDLRTSTSTGGELFFQCKTTLTLSEKDRSELAGVVRQFVAQMARGARKSATERRPLNNAIDRLVLAVGPHAPSTIRTDLSQALHAIRPAVKTTLAEEVDQNRNQRHAKPLRILRRLFNSAWTARHGASPNRDDWALFVQLLRIRQLDTTTDGADWRECDGLLRNHVLANPTDAGVARSAIGACVRSFGPNRTGSDREYFRTQLAQVPLSLKTSRDLRAEVVAFQGSTNSSAVHDKIDLLLANSAALPSEQDIRAQAISDQDSCRFRSDALQRQFDQLEHELTHDFADQCLSWLRTLASTSPNAPALPQAILLERISEEGVVRVKRGAGVVRKAALVRLKLISDMLRVLLPLLDSVDQLRVSSRVAFLDSWLLSNEAGLAQLAPRSDPFAIKRRLAIFINAERFLEAAEQVRGAVPAVEWVEQAIVVAAHANDWAEADRFFAWALDNTSGLSRRHSILVFAETLITLTHRSDVAPPSELPNHKERFRRCWTLLQPLAEASASSNSSRTRLDYYILSVATEFAVRLNSTLALKTFAAALAQQKPINGGLAALAATNRIPADPDWPQRLRTEGEPTFDRLLLAVALEARQPDRQLVAFETAKRLASSLSDDEQRRKLHATLMDLEHRLDEAHRPSLHAFAASLLKPDDREAQLWAAARVMQAGDLVKAGQLLSSLEDPKDNTWLQLHGQWLLKTGRVDEGVNALTQAALRFSDPVQLEAVGALALGHKQWAQAVLVFEKALSINSGDQRAREGAATAHLHLHRFAKALPLLDSLSKEFPTDSGYTINTAICLAREARSGEAIQLLRVFVEQGDPPLMAVVTLAQLMAGEGIPRDGFDLLHHYRKRFWDQYEYVGAYLSMAYSAEREDLGRQALTQLQVLQERGEAPADVLVPTSLEQLLEHGKQHSELEIRRALAVLQGQFPWLNIAEFRNDPAIRAWSQRTGIRRWLWESPVSLSDSAVYCTNGFTVPQAGGDLVSIECSARGAPVVADLTALLTLDQLGLLQVAFDYFGVVHIPDSYLFKLLVDSDQLQPHQPSRRTALSVLAAAMLSGKLHAESTITADTSKVIDEHYPDTQPPPNVYHLQDLAAAISTAGVATDLQLKTLQSISHRAATASASHPAIERDDWLVISLSTMCSIHSIGLLDAVLELFRVQLAPGDRDSVMGERQWFESQQQLEAQNRRLMTVLRDDKRLQRHPPALPTATSQINANMFELGLATDAAQLAKTLKLPLLADDRVLQAIRFREQPVSASSSFGTPQLLRAMTKHSVISPEEYALHVRKLMSWRYRFIPISADLLAQWARQSLTNVPGPDLMAAARYIHDCCRDPGLFGGLESCVPPQSMGMKYFQATEAVVGDFVASLWVDESLAEAAISAITVWAMSALLPSPPLSTEPTTRLFADLRNSLFTTHLILSLVRCRNQDRARRCIRLVASELGIPDRQLHRLGSELAHELFQRAE
jgi:hypothetical protein